MCIDNRECIRSANHSYLCKKLHNTNRYLLKEFRAALMPAQVGHALLLIVQMDAFLLLFCCAPCIWHNLSRCNACLHSNWYHSKPGWLVCGCHFSLPFGVSCCRLFFFYSSYALPHSLLVVFVVLTAVCMLFPRILCVHQPALARKQAKTITEAIDKLKIDTRDDRKPEPETHLHGQSRRSRL